MWVTNEYPRWGKLEEKYWGTTIIWCQPARVNSNKLWFMIFNVKIRFMLLSGDSSSHPHGTGMQISGTCSEHAHAGLVAAEAQWTQYQPSCSYHGEYGRSRMTGSWITGWGKHRPSSRGNLGGRSAPDPDRGKAMVSFGWPTPAGAPSIQSATWLSCSWLWVVFFAV